MEWSAEKKDKIEIEKDKEKNKDLKTSQTVHNKYVNFALYMSLIYETTKRVAIDATLNDRVGKGKERGGGVLVLVVMERMGTRGRVEGRGG